MTKTFMRQEIDEIPEAVARLLRDSVEPVREIGEAIRKFDPLMIATVARGSSDHAAYFLKYAFEIALGLPGASLGPSLASIYGVVPRTDRAVVLAISQSGQSPDIISMTEATRQGGALTIALVNTLLSPLADSCAHALDISAGPEKSVAATKSFVCSVVAGLALLAEIGAEASLVNALQAFPEKLKDALDCEWPDLADQYENSGSVYVIGRGPSLAIAHEASLKFKETCAMHAEAYSAAEIMHGPIELAGTGFPVLALAARDKAEGNVAKIADELARNGASVHATSPMCQSAHVLPVPDAGHPLLNALVQIVPCYAFLEDLSRQRGRDPDRPARLSKVTETI
jgi:glucosamine--fructose-6-phosphate aminotransferase (isomerizing)